MSTNLKLEDVFDTINNCARAGREAPEIISLLENKFSYNYKYMNKLFRDKYRLTIRECIKMKRLQYAYEVWINKGRPCLTEKGEFDGIISFKGKFRAVFGDAPEDIFNENIDLSAYMPESPVFQSLNKMNYMLDYRIKGGDVIVELNTRNMLLYLMMLPAYVIPREEWELMIKANIINDSSDKALLIVILAETYCKNSSYKTTLDEIINRAEMLKLYNVNNPYQLDDCVVFSPVIGDCFKNVFEEEIENVMYKMSIAPLCRSMNRFLRAFARWKASNGLKNIENLAKFCGLEVEKTKELLWEYIRIGYIRYAV